MRDGGHWEKKEEKWGPQREIEVTEEPQKAGPSRPY